jgi:NADP-dependent aldehyde dehydrogenase
VKPVLSTNPRTLESRPTALVETSESDLEEALSRATAAQVGLRESSPAERSRMLRSIAAAIDDDREAIVSLADQETALGTARLNGEVDRVLGQFRLFADVVEDADFYGAIIDTAQNEVGLPDVRRLLVPLGVVGVFGAANFPLAFSVAGGDTASALAAGCSVVAKAHPSHPLVSQRSAAAIRDGLSRAGQSPDCLSVVYGMSAGAALVEHEAISAIGFTGSVAGGRMLHDLAGQRPRPIPFYGELGSINPVVVTPAAADARCREIADGFFESLTLGMGQFCTKPGLIFIPQDGSEAFVSRIQELIDSHPGGYLLNESIQRSFNDQVNRAGALDWVDLVHANDSSLDGTGVGPAMVVTHASVPEWDGGELIDECFGPFAVIVTYDSIDHVPALLAALPDSLTGTIHAEAHDEDAQPVLAALTNRVGRIVWNGFPTGVRVGWAMHHGGSYPAATTALHSSVGATSILRWQRPIAYQGVPDDLLPIPLRDENTLSLSRRIDGDKTHRDISDI